MVSSMFAVGGISFLCCFGGYLAAFFLTRSEVLSAVFSGIILLALWFYFPSVSQVSSVAGKFALVIFSIVMLGGGIGGGFSCAFICAKAKERGYFNY